MRYFYRDELVQCNYAKQGSVFTPNLYYRVLYSGSKADEPLVLLGERSTLLIPNGEHFLKLKSEAGDTVRCENIGTSGRFANYIVVQRRGVRASFGPALPTEYRFLEKELVRCHTAAFEPRFTKDKYYLVASSGNPCVVFDNHNREAGVDHRVVAPVTPMVGDTVELLYDRPSYSERSVKRYLVWHQYYEGERAVFQLRSLGTSEDEGINIEASGLVVIGRCGVPVGTDAWNPTGSKEPNKPSRLIPVDLPLKARWDSERLRLPKLPGGSEAPHSYPAEAKPQQEPPIQASCLPAHVESELAALRNQIGALEAERAQLRARLRSPKKTPTVQLTPKPKKRWTVD